MSGKTHNKFEAKDAANLQQQTQQMLSNTRGKLVAKHVANLQVQMQQMSDNIHGKRRQNTQQNCNKCQVKLAEK
jgi:hypothetical protein